MSRPYSWSGGRRCRSRASICSCPGLPCRVALAAPLVFEVNETVMLDIRDWRPDFKADSVAGPAASTKGRTRMVPAINGIDDLLNWWLTDVRHQFGDDWNDPDAPLLPSERRDPELGRNRRAGDDALRSGFTKAVNTWLPEWSGRLTPHGMRQLLRVVHV